jgi:hypothetical protein
LDGFGTQIALFYYGRCYVQNSFRAALVLSTLLFLTVGIASADTLITYQLLGATNVSFQVPVNPTVIAFDAGMNFIVSPTNLLVNGVITTGDTVDFFNSALGGGFAVVNPGGTTAVVNTSGPQVYTGPESAPTMLGTIASGVPLTDFGTGAPVGTLTTPGTPGPVGSVTTPEPSATVLLGIGLLAVGLAVLGFKPKFAISAN